jgi:hypothetical protein
MAATGAAALVLVVVGAFGLLGGGGPDLAAPDGATIDYVKLEYTSTINPVCEGGEIIDNGGFDEATIEIWGPNSDDLTLMVATFPDGSTERMMVEGDPGNPDYIWVEGNPEDYPSNTKLRVVQCAGVVGSPGLLDAFSPGSAGAIVPFHMLAPPSGFEGFAESFIPEQAPTPTQWNGNAVLLYEFRRDEEAGSNAIDLYVTEDDSRVLRFHAEQSLPGVGDAVVDYSVVEEDEVPADSVSFAKSELTPIAQVFEFAAEDCPVTIPKEGFTPPDGYPATPSDPDSVWFGKDELWTALSTDGTYDPRKSVWWSVNFPGGSEEPEPKLTVRYTLLNTARSLTFETTAATNAYTDADGWFIIAGIDTQYEGCWQVEAVYKNASLSYVYYNPEGADPEPVVPDVVGMTVERAGNVLHDAGYEASSSAGIRQEDIVCDQDPSPGAELSPGTPVKLDAAPEGECATESPPSTNPNFQTYTDELGRLWYATSCPGADVLVSGGVAAADGLPQASQTLLEKVETYVVAARAQGLTNDDEYLLDRTGVTNLDIVPRNGEVWDLDENGNVIVTQQPDYMIMATVDARFECPSTPSAYNGVPVAYVRIDPELGILGCIAGESEEPTVWFTCGQSAETYRMPTGRALVIDQDLPLPSVVAEVIRQTLEGPTAGELSNGFTSFFSDESADALESVTFSESSGLTVIDFNEGVTVNNASTSTGSEIFLGELLANVFQFDEVRSVEFRINGSCEAFWAFLQGDGCPVIDRP